MSLQEEIERVLAKLREGVLGNQAIAVNILAIPAIKQALEDAERYRYLRAHKIQDDYGVGRIVFTWVSRNLGGGGTLKRTNGFLYRRSTEEVMPCTTHHEACECREAEFAKVTAERDRYRKAIEDAPHDEDCSSLICSTCGGDIFNHMCLNHDWTQKGKCDCWKAKALNGH